MKSNNLQSNRVIAIDPTSKGFGFVVLESPTTLADWGVKTMRKQDEEVVLAKAMEVILHYRADVVVLQEPTGSRRYPRVRALLEGLSRLAKNEGLKSHRFTTARVKKVFSAFRANTKQEIAMAVVQQLPELAPELPPLRKAWMSEDYHMAIFDAAALALTYFLSRQLRSKTVSEPSRAQPQFLLGP